MNDALQQRPAVLERFAAEHAAWADAPEWFARRRREAHEAFCRLGFPSARLEAWKNTNPAPLARGDWRPAAAGEGASFDTAALEASGLIAAPWRIVFVNGRLREELGSLDGLPGGLAVAPFATALAGGAGGEAAAHFDGQLQDSDSALAQLNSALFVDGAFVRAAAGMQVEQPLQVLHLSTGDGILHSPRSLVVAEDGARLTVIETFASIDGGAGWTNAVGEIVAGDGAFVDHVRQQEEARDAYHTGTLRTRQGRDSHLQCHNYDFGSRLTRLDAHAVLDGSGAECNLFGLYMPHGDQHVDNHTVLDHAQPHCNSRELYKGILSGAARSVFNGRIIVRQDAQKTDAKQSNPNLLLSDEALAHTRPQLEIYADDVRCTHGATVGRLDADALFYLRSRGIGAAAARNLLIRAFAGEVLDRLPVAALRPRLEARIEERLPR